MKAASSGVSPEAYHVKKGAQACHALDDIGHRLGLDGVNQPDQGREKGDPAVGGLVRSPNRNGQIKQQIQKNAAKPMNKHIHQVVAQNLVPPQVVVQGEADVGHRPAIRRPAESGFDKAARCDIIDTNGLVQANIFYVVKHKGGLQGVAVGDHNDKGKHKRYDQSVIHCPQNVGTVKSVYGMLS
ncbi:MAG: hypothetical protein PVF97_03265 [Desulfobacterales bacterium]